MSSDPSYTLLVVDDDSVFRTMLRNFLNKEGYSVIEGKDGNEALLLFEKHQPDLILMDAKMPHLDGFEACRKIKLLPENKHLSILIITALEDRASVDRAFEANATDYLTKPIYWNALRNRIRYLLEKRTMQEEAEKQNKLLRILNMAMDQASEGITITGKDNKIEYINHAFSEITGYSREEVLGKNPKVLQSKQETPSFYQKMWNSILQTGRWSGTIRNKRKNGEIYPEHLSIQSIKDQYDQVIHYIAIFSNIRDKLALEEQLRQAQKMEAVGTLVGGIAHDFNNLLAGITGNIFIAKSYQNGLKPVREKLDIIEALSFRAAEMIARLMAFARKDVIMKKNFVLNSFIRELTQLMKRSIPENIDFQQNVCEQELFFCGDATQVQQICLNLLNNARDAVEHATKPQITLELKTYTPDSNFCAIHPEAQAELNYALLTVKDNGMGISPDDLQHVFEPFFTTKEVGKGTGLGLSMIYGAVGSYKGIIEIQSKLGKGSNFLIYLPLVEQLVVETVDENYEIQRGRGQGVLIADDEEGLLAIEKEVLEEMGYRVFDANNGIEAVKLFEAHQKEISIAVLDVVMPQMGGVAAAKKIREISTEIPLIFATGYDKAEISKELSNLGNATVLNKPYNFEIFSHTIQSLISKETEKV